MPFGIHPPAWDREPLPLTERMDHSETAEAMEILIRGQDLPDPMLDQKGGKVRIMNQVPPRTALPQDILKNVRVPFGLAQQADRGRRQKPSDSGKSRLQGSRRTKHAGVRHNPQEFVETDPRKSPRLTPLGQLFHEEPCLCMVGGVFSVGVNQDIRVDGPHINAVRLRCQKDGRGRPDPRQAGVPFL